MAYIKTPRMKGKVSVFSNGKMISVGTRSEREARADFRVACEVLLDVGVKTPRNPKIIIHNMVATGEIGKPVNIEKLASRPNVLYEPEQFPAAIYHAEELEGASVLVFASGKVVFAGLKSLRLLETARHTLEKLSEYC